jgi:D-tyrosyl-tRNA(Tyr) deacylase
MKIVIQRVSEASVEAGGETLSSIGPGLVLLAGVEKDDTAEDIRFAVQKVVNLRIFNDENRHMNIDVRGVEGSILVISQFTVAGSIRKGRRPSFDKAAEPEKAEALYRLFVDQLKETGIPVKEGRFGAMMQVRIVNDGPVTFWLDSKQPRRSSA